MAITLYGSSSTPSDNGTNTANPTVVNVPGAMQAGDLCFIVACAANTSGTLSISETGGQTWTALTQRNQTRNRANCFWCRFNGTWTTNPSVTMAGTANNIVRLLVFRGDYGTANQWYVDVAEASATYAAPSSPYTVTVPNIVVAHSGTLGIITWTSRDDNTWGTLTSGWTALTPAQVRNTSGSYDQSVTNAYQVFPAAGNSLSISQRQATLGGDAGTYYSIVFAQAQTHSAVGSSAATSSATATAKADRFVVGTSAAQSSATATGYPLKFAAGSSAAVSSCSASAASEDKAYGFYHWTVKDPAIGTIPGPKVEDACRIVAVSSYVVGGTSAAFNIEERTTPEEAGTDVLASDQTADADGATTSTIENAEIATDATLALGISAVTGEVTQLAVTAKYYRRIARIVTAAASCAAHSAASAAALVEHAAVAVVNAVASAFARATATLVLAGTCAAMSSTAAGVSGIAIVDVAGSSAGSSSCSASAAIANKIFDTYTWVVDNPAVGGIAGPKIAVDCHVSEVSSYVTAATSATFNVEERTSPESAGTNLLGSDQAADVDGTSTTTIANDYLVADNTLYLDISAVSGTPGQLAVTVQYYYYLTAPVSTAVGSSSAVSSASAAAMVLHSAVGSSAASSEATATATVGANIRKTFYHWTVSNVTTGRIPGPEIVEDAIVKEVSGYIVGGTGVAFNIEERTDPSVVGPTLLTSDLSIDANGELTTAFSDETLNKGNTLFLYIRSLDGTPTQVAVTMHVEPGIVARATSRAVSSCAASAYKELAAAGSSASRFGCTGDFVRGRFVYGSASSDGGATAGAAVTIIRDAEASSAGVSSCTATATVGIAGFTASSAGVSSATASALVTRYVSGSSSAVSSVTANAYSGESRVRATSAGVSSCTATADFKNKGRGQSYGVSSATATANLVKNLVGSSAGASSTTAKLTYTIGTLKGTSAGASAAVATADVYGPAELWVKINGSWRMIANGIFS